MEFSIDGTVAQSARLTLAKGETVWASKGSIIAYGASLEWDLRMPGSFAGALKRSLSGEGLTTGHLAAFSCAVDYDIETVGSLRKTLFSKEGLFMTRLRGPGTVRLQTLTPGKAGRSTPPPR